MENLPLQVDQAGKKAEDLMKQHTGEAPNGQEPTTDLEGKLAKLQAKFDVLQGKYKKEIENVDLKDIQRLTSENALLKQQLGEVQTALAASNDLVKEVKDQLENPEQPAPETPIDLNELLTDEERKQLQSEELDEKTLQIFAKLAQKAGVVNLASQLKEISKKVETVEKRVETAENVQHQVSIHSAVPDFDKINTAPEFHAWLDEPANEFSPRKNRQDLQDALSAGDFDTVKRGIEAFKKATGFGNDQPPKEKEPPIEPDESIANDGDQIVGKQKSYTLAEVKQFYMDQTKGRWVGREKEAAAIDRDIQKAQSEGRIIQ